MEPANCSFIGNASEMNVSGCILGTPPTKVIAQEDFFGQSALAFVMSFSEATLKVPNTEFGLYLGHFPALVEVTVTLTVGLAFLVLCAYLAYSIQTSVFLNLHLKRALLWTGIVGVPLLPFLILSLHGPMASVLANFTMSFLAVCLFFRLIELVCKTGPKGFDSSLSRYVLYVTSPAELAFDGEGRIQQVSPGRIKECLTSTVGHFLLMMLALCLGRLTNFLPWLPEGVEPHTMPLLGNPATLPAAHLQAVQVYVQLTVMLQLFRLLCAIAGMETCVAFRQPLILSTSVKDFWGRRWNLLIHRLMHRSFFTPIAPIVGPQAGAIAAFLVSGVFHEYMWLLTNWHEADYTPFGPLKFFAVQFLLLTAESMLKRTWIGKAFSSLPSPVLTILTTLAILPSGHFFLSGLRGMRADSVRVYPNFSITK
mmetsp:Transcript_100121/g.188572  ORF Transcript_100121/g.188572 Transcript_100121/m.188572 type:complete len:424 (-) Transcript_100121:201-1472(-)